MSSIFLSIFRVLPIDKGCNFFFLKGLKERLNGFKEIGELLFSLNKTSHLVIYPICGKLRVFILS